MKTLITFPTQRTRARLSEIFTSSPISLNFETMVAVIATVEDELLPPVGSVDPSPVYHGRFTEYGIRTDPFKLSPQLVGVLAGTRFQSRLEGLGVSESQAPRLVFLDYSPAQSTTVRSFNVSIADTLVLREQEPFTFEGEGVL